MLIGILKPISKPIWKSEKTHKIDKKIDKLFKNDSADIYDQSLELFIVKNKVLSWEAFCQSSTSGRKLINFIFNLKMYQRLLKHPTCTILQVV